MIKLPHTITLMFMLVLALCLVACSDTSSDKKLEANLQVVIPLTQWKQQVRFTQAAGHNIAYWEAGNPNNETIVLIHGFPSSAWDWQHIWRNLAKNYHLVAMDLLGYGYSDKPSDYPYRIVEQADIVMGLVEQLAPAQFHLIAHDYGVSVAQELLSRHNERQDKGFLLSLCLLNGGAFPEAQNHTLAMNLLKGPLGPYLIRLSSRERFMANFSSVFSDNAQPNTELLDGFWSLISERQGINNFPQIMQYINERHQQRDRWVGALTNSSVPIRVINGTADSISGENMLQRYEALVPEPDVVRLAGIGHYPQLEAPHAVLMAYTRFLNTVKQR